MAFRFRRTPRRRLISLETQPSYPRYIVTGRVCQSRDTKCLRDGLVTSYRFAHCGPVVVGLRHDGLAPGCIQSPIPPTMHRFTGES